MWRLYRLRRFLVGLAIAAALLATSWCIASVVTGSFRLGVLITAAAAAGGVVGRIWKEYG